MHLWNKFRNRIITLKYRISCQNLGISTQHPFFGTIDILYNKNPVPNLYNALITLSNDSNRDLKEMELNVFCDKKTMILRDLGIKVDSPNPLPFTDKYERMLIDGKPEDRNYLYQRRDYIISVLNRGDKLEISLWMINSQNRQPVIAVRCEHPGVKVKYLQKPPYELFGEPLQYCVLVGWIIVLLLCIPIIILIKNITIAVILVVIMGLFASMIGWVIIKFYKSLIKLLS